jgi:outer membrane receptor protein involved in Fe transport
VDRHTLGYGAEGHYIGNGDIRINEIDSSYFPPPQQPSDSDGKRDITTRYGFYAQDLWNIIEPLDVEIGVRYEDYKADGGPYEDSFTGLEEDAPVIHESRWSPRAAVAYRLWEGGQIRGSYALAYRFPTNPEYYWWYAGFQPPDREDLVPESSAQFEVEFSQRLADRYEIKLAGYHYIVDDYIRTIFGYKPSRVIYNIDRVKFSGFELKVGAELPMDLYLWGNYTYQETEKDGDILDESGELTDELVELPNNKFNLGIDYGKPEQIQASLIWRYVDERQAVVGDLTTPGGSSLGDLTSYNKLDLHLSYPFIRRDQFKGNLRVSAENILDKEYSEEYGFEMPGTTYSAGLEMTF